MPTLSAPAKIFVTITKALTRRLARAKKPKDLLEEKEARDFRGELFQLEGWARLHRNWPNEKNAKMFSRLRDQSKEIEDAFGGLDTVTVLRKEATKRKSPSLARHLAKELKSREKAVKQLLRDEEWLPKKKGRSRTEKIFEKLEDVEWLPVADHIAYLRNEIAKEIGEFEKRFEKEIRPVLMKSTYDRAEVEDFLHEWRRQLRWYAIYLQTSRGLFGLKASPAKPTKTQKELIHDMAKNPFSKLATSSKTKAKVDRIAYYELTRLIDEVGKAKEESELFYYMKEQARAAKVAKSDAEADRFVRGWYGDIPEQTPKKVQALLAEYDRFEPLSKIRRDLAPK